MQVSEQIIAVLDNLAQRFGVVIDWGQQNVMPYIQELCGKYIKWEIATSIAWICFSVIFVVGGIVLMKIACKWIAEHKGNVDYEIGAGMVIATGIICWLVALGIITTQVFDIIKCCMFPELQVFEFIKSMMTGTP